MAVKKGSCDFTVVIRFKFGQAGRDAKTEKLSLQIGKIIHELFAFHYEHLEQAEL
jgi:hypothetical protein